MHASRCSSKKKSRDILLNKIAFHFSLFFFYSNRIATFNRKPKITTADARAVWTRNSNVMTSSFFFLKKIGRSVLDHSTESYGKV